MSTGRPRATGRGLISALARKLCTWRYSGEQQGAKSKSKSRGQSFLARCKKKMERKLCVPSTVIYSNIAVLYLPSERTERQAVLLSTSSEQRTASSENRNKQQAIKPGPLAKNEQASKHTHA